MNDQVKIDDHADISGHVVALNRLMAELNKESRRAFKPDHQAIENLASEIKAHASMIEFSMQRANL